MYQNFLVNSKNNYFQTIQFPVPNKYRIPKGFTFSDYQTQCLENIEKKLSENTNIAAFCDGEWCTSRRRGHSLSKGISKKDRSIM